MSSLVDTSVLVCYLTGDPPDLAERAAAIVDGEEDLLITDVAIAEAAGVLTSVYGVARAKVVDGLVELLQKENLQPFRLDKIVVIEALLLCRPSGRVSFADALIWAAARVGGVECVYTVDDRVPNTEVEFRG